MENIILSRENLAGYIDRISKIHKSAYHGDHFTSSFSGEKLAEYYTDLILHSDLSVVCIDTNRSESVGFIVGGEGVSEGVRKFISNNRRYLMGLMLRNPVFLWEKLFLKISSIIGRKRRKSVQVVRFRLLSISVAREWQSKGVGKAMLEDYERKLLEAGVVQYGLSVRDSNIAAIKFYNKNGFMEESRYMGSVYFRKVIFDDCFDESQ